jgi:hypothetical protein
MATAINVPRYIRRIEAARVPRADADAIAEGGSEELDGGLKPRLERIEWRLERIEVRLAEMSGELCARHLPSYVPSCAPASLSCAESCARPPPPCRVRSPAPRMMC